MTILVLNFVAYVIWAIVIFMRSKTLSVYLFMVVFFAMISSMSIIIVNNGVYFREFEYYNPEDLSIVPYILCFVSYFVFFQPLKAISRLDKLDGSIFDDAWFKKGLFVWIVCMVIRTVVKFSEAVFTLSTSINEAYESRHLEGEVLFHYSPIMTKFMTHSAMIHLATAPIVMYFIFYSLIYKKISTIFAVFLIVLCFLPSILNSIGMGSRGSLFMDLFCFLFFVLLFWNKLNGSLKLHISLLSIFILTVSLLYMWLISIDRATTNDDDATVKIARYFGECFPNLGFQFWGKVHSHPMGDRMFSLKDFDSSYTPFDIIQYWEQYTGVRTYIFKTLYGDFYIEYGTILGIVFLTFIAWLFYRFIKSKGVNLYSLPLVYFYFQICVYSFAGQTKHGRFMLVQLLYIFLSMYFIKCIQKKKC